MHVRLRLAITLVAISRAVSGASQTPEPQAISTAAAPRLALSPGVISVTSQPGVSSTHPLTMTNLTPKKVTFVLRAFDVVIRDGKRVFVPAGEAEGGIARSAIFEPPAIELNPGESAQVRVTLTVPGEPTVRAVVAMFQGQTALPGNGSVMVTGSLGTLITYNLSDSVAVRMGEPIINPQSDSSNLIVSGSVDNDGREPVVVHGTLAILRSSGQLIGRVAIASHRLLPGETFDCAAEYPHNLSSGSYRAMMSLEYAGGVQTRGVAFEVP